MAKRMRDTETYKDRFVKGLSADHKHLWFYILDDCDHAGIWRVDLEGAALYTGCTFDEESAKAALAPKIQVLGADYWFIPGFLKFQYGKEANSKAGVVISAKKRLAEFGIDTLLTPTDDTPPTLPTLSLEGSDTPKSKDKDKGKVKAKGKSLDLELFDEWWEIYPKKDAKLDAQAVWSKLPKETRLLCIDAVRWQLKSPAHLLKDEKRFIKLPAGWLREGRWLDQKESGRGTGRGEGWTAPSGGDDF